MDSPNTTGASPTTTPVDVPVKPKRGRVENLVRNPKGVQPAHLKALQQDPERVVITKRTLYAEITRALHARNGAKLQELAESIVEHAIEGNSTCLQLIAERLMPVEKEQGQGRVVFEGIKLEVVGGAEGTRTTVALVRGSESHSGAGSVAALDTTSTESVQEPRDAVILEPGTPETPG